MWPQQDYVNVLHVGKVSEEQYWRMHLKVAICGCSWSSRDNSQPDTEFGSMVAEYITREYEESFYLNLATVGASNFVIRNQIDFAIDTAEADLIIVNWTTPDRIEWQYNNESSFNPTLTIENFDYSINPEKLVNRKHVVDCNPAMAFNSITTMLDEDSFEHFRTSDLAVQGLPVTEEMFNSFKKHYLYWYDSKLELAKQIHLVKSAVFDLEVNDIPYLMSPNTLFYLQDINENAYYWEKLVDFIPGRKRIKGVASMLREHDEELKGWHDYSKNPGAKLSYHISPQAQKHYFNNFLKPKLDNLLSKL